MSVAGFIMRFVIVLVIIFLNTCSGAEKVLTNENWRDMLQGEWMVKFYAPWCPACRAMSTTWKEFAIWAQKSKSLSVGSVDVTEQGELNGRFMVTSLPTIYHVKDGEFRQYKSTRTLKDFTEFIVEKKWQSTTPMSSWLKPDSFAMSSVSKLFSFSMNLKSLHESLRSEYGLPGWASMLLFGLAVVIIGLLLGIGLVLFIDSFTGLQESSENEKEFPKTHQEIEKEEKITSKERNGETENEDGVHGNVGGQDEKQEKKVRKRTVKTD